MNREISMCLRKVIKSSAREEEATKTYKFSLWSMKLIPKMSN